MVAIQLARGVAAELFPGYGFPVSEEEKAAVHHLVMVDPDSYQARVFDRAVMRGDGFFEAISVIDGKVPVSLDLHLARLEHNAKALDMPIPDEKAFHEACEELIAHYSGGHDDPMLRILISRGADPGTGVGRRHHPGMPSIWMYLDGEGEKHETTPLRMVSLSAGRDSRVAENSPWLMLGLKTLSYVVNMATARAAERMGYDDALFVTTDGYCLESPHANIVAKFGDTWVTPDPVIGVLHGTSQRELFAYVRRLGKITRYQDLPVEELKKADEVYQTRGGWVIPVKSLDDTEFAVNTEFVKLANHAIHYEQEAQKAEWAHDNYQPTR